MSILNATGHLLAFDDLPANNNPQRRLVDWKRSRQGIPVQNPGSQPYQVDGLAELVLFNGSRTLTADNTTQYAVESSPLDASSRYRLAWTGVGTAPGFRTARTVVVGTFTMVLNANSTLTVTHSGGAVFGSVLVGDIVFIPGANTGDAALFDALNEGEWTVLSATATTLVLARLPGAIFTGAAEVKTTTLPEQFQVYSSAGVQVGDSLDLISGFFPTSLHTYKVIAVTASRVEFVSTVALALQTVIPGGSAVRLFSASKRLIYIESDQEVAVKMNGNTDETCRIEPVLPGDSGLVGWFEKWGTTYSVTIKNRSTVRANIFLISAE